MLRCFLSHPPAILSVLESLESGLGTRSCFKNLQTVLKLIRSQKIFLKNNNYCNSKAAFPNGLTGATEVPVQILSSTSFIKDITITVSVPIRQHQ